jgi:hypothetical protein
MRNDRARSKLSKLGTGNSAARRFMPTSRENYSKSLRPTCQPKPKRLQRLDFASRQPATGAEANRHRTRVVLRFQANRPFRRGIGQAAVRSRRYIPFGRYDPSGDETDEAVSKGDRHLARTFIGVAKTMDCSEPVPF